MMTSILTCRASSLLQCLLMFKGKEKNRIFGAVLNHCWYLVFFMTACVTGFGTTVFVLLGYVERQKCDMTVVDFLALTRNRSCLLGLCFVSITVKVTVP
jgi:hypothetical protein